MEASELRESRDHINAAFGIIGRHAPFGRNKLSHEDCTRKTKKTLQEETGSPKISRRFSVAPKRDKEREREEKKEREREEEEDQKGGNMSFMFFH